MKNATYELRKCRAYHCYCGWICFRPLKASDTNAPNWPVPCEKCGQNLTRVFFNIWDLKQVDEHVSKCNGEES